MWKKIKYSLIAFAFNFLADAQNLNIKHIVFRNLNNSELKLFTQEVFGDTITLKMFRGVLLSNKEQKIEILKDKGEFYSDSLIGISSNIIEGPDSIKVSAGMLSCEFPNWCWSNRFQELNNSMLVIVQEIERVDYYYLFNGIAIKNTRQILNVDLNEQEKKEERYINYVVDSVINSEDIRYYYVSSEYIVQLLGIEVFSNRMIFNEKFEMLAFTEKGVWYIREDKIEQEIFSKLR